MWSFLSNDVVDIDYSFFIFCLWGKLLYRDLRCQHAKWPTLSHTSEDDVLPFAILGVALDTYQNMCDVLVDGVMVVTYAWKHLMARKKFGYKSLKSIRYRFFTVTAQKVGDRNL